MASTNCTAAVAIHSHASRLERTITDYRLTPHALGNMFGVGSFLAQRSGTDSQLLVRRTVQLGASWVREEFTASALHESTSSKYLWARYDSIIKQETRAGLHVLGLLDYSNTWSYADHGTMPHRGIGRLAKDFARYAFALSRHYRGEIQYWEVWNEPNLRTFWHPTPNARDYAGLLTAANRAIKQANPRAKVVLAGTSGIDLQFIRSVAQQTNSFDVISVHPYRNVPEAGFLQSLKSLRAFHKPIWFSEIGWTAGDGCDSCTGDADQARFLIRLYTLAAVAGVQRVFWYDLRDDVHPASDPEAHFGLVRRNLSVKPAFISFAFLSHMLAGARYAGADSIGHHQIYQFRFARARTSVVVLWNAGETTRPVRIAWPYPVANFVDSSGQTLAQLEPVAGHITVIAPQGGEPFYVATTVGGYHAPQTGALLHDSPTHRERRRTKRHVGTRRVEPAAHRGSAGRTTYRVARHVKTRTSRHG